MINQIICAAIKFSDGTIIRGHRHDFCFKYAMEIPRLKIFINMPSQVIQGFIDANNTFVDRQTAARIQIAAEIISFQTKQPLEDGQILFSEDLY